MGTLPLEFKPGTTRLTLNIDGTETFDVIGERKPRATLTLVIHRKNGETVEVPVTCRSEEHTSELQSLMRNSYAVFCLKKKNINYRTISTTTQLTQIHTMR